MVSSFCRIAVGAVTIALVRVPAHADAAVLATAMGTITIAEARTGLRPPACSELVVEARDALDNHLIAVTHPTTDEIGVCHYAVSVPAQTAIWLHLQPTLVASARLTDAGDAKEAPVGRGRASSGSIGLRFTVIAPTTYFFEPNERKIVLLKY